MGIVLVFEPACDSHWMKDVVQLPNALSRKINGKNAVLVTRPNHKQGELKKHIDVIHLGKTIQENYDLIEYADFSKIITDHNWYILGCKKAARIGKTLIIYPWYGDAFKGAKQFKLHRWLSFQKASVVLKTDGWLNRKAEQKATLKEMVSDWFKYFYIDKLICENAMVYKKLLVNHSHLSRKLTLIPNCPLDLYHLPTTTPYLKRPKNFLFVGRISDKEKGVDILLEAWFKIFNRLEGWSLQLVGPCSDDFKFTWQAKINESKAENSVQWCPAATPNQLLSYYSNARIVVCSSRKESGPIVLSEANFAGCAFIGTAVGESTHLLEDLPGLVANVDELSDVMILFAQNDELAIQQIEKLRKKIDDRKWSEQVEKITKI